jgi:hypothetical protein
MWGFPELASGWGLTSSNRGWWYRPLYFNNLPHFWDKVDIVYVMHFSDVTLLFEQWIIFKNLQFILLFLNIWTLTFSNILIIAYSSVVTIAKWLDGSFESQNRLWKAQHGSRHESPKISKTRFLYLTLDSKICKKKYQQFV